LAESVGYFIQPEAATLNFYPRKGVMGGHVDDSEYEMRTPIVSCSFGCSAIFLLGGETRDDNPTPIYINSGDVIIMGGYSRKCYHGVARIIPNSLLNVVYNNNNKLI